MGPEKRRIQAEGTDWINGNKSDRRQFNFLWPPSDFQICLFQRKNVHGLDIWLRSAASSLSAPVVPSRDLRRYERAAHTCLDWCIGKAAMSEN